MNAFIDKKKREWHVGPLDARRITDVRESCDPKFFLGDVETGFNMPYQRLKADPILVANVVCVLCSGQRREKNVTEEDFLSAMDGDAIAGAETALEAVIRDFCRGRMLLMHDAYVKQAAAADAGMEMTFDKVLNPEVMEALAAEVQEKLDKLMQSKNASAGPASSE